MPKSFLMLYICHAICQWCCEQTATLALLDYCQCVNICIMLMTFGAQKKGGAKGGANGSRAEPEAPSQEDVKQQAKEARSWIQAWRKKQPVKANA